MRGEGIPHYRVIGQSNGTTGDGGSIAARGMPSSARQLESWAPTVLISLLPQNTEWLRRVTEMLQIRWYDRPIGPICNARKPISRQDLISFKSGIFEAIAELEKGARILVHCIQGLHRMGIFLLLLLVAKGYGVERALVIVREMQYVMWDELSRRWSWNN